MEQVGYDTYCKLLDEVIKEMQGVEVQEEKEIQIDMNVSSFIPDEYIENSSQKIEVYQDIALSKTEEDIGNIIDELIDRYGNFPEEVQNLLEIARIKILCREANVIKITQRGEKAVIYFDFDKFNMDIVDRLIKEYKNNIRFSTGKEPYITLQLAETGEKQVLNIVKEFLQKCAVNFKELN